jgi:hypothetical protein
MAERKLITDSPDLHGFVILGADPVFLYHLPMFSMCNHMYQLVLRVSLPERVREEISHHRDREKTVPLILGNTARNRFTVPELVDGNISTFQADVFRGVPVDPLRDTPLLPDIRIEINRTVLVRHFDPMIDFPRLSTYVVFGSSKQLYAAHYLTMHPDFDHVCEISDVPSWLPSLAFSAGIHTNLIDTPPRARISDFETYRVRYFGSDGTFTLKTGATLWFDEASLNEGMKE